MRDPIEHLDEFDPGADMTPLPPAEIRARGDRFRRRRQGLAVAGGVLAIALVAVPVGVLAQRDDDAPAPAEPSPAPTRIPDDFPLDAGMGDAAVTDTAELGGLDLCGTRPLGDVEPRDVRSARVSGGETSDIRTLFLLDGVDAVRDTYEVVLDAASDCSIAAAEDPDPADGDVSLRPVPSGWSGVTITRDLSGGEATTEPAVEVIHVVTVGEALVVTSTFGAWTADVDSGVAETQDALRPVVAAMDVFSPPQASDPPGEEPGLTEAALPTEDEVPSRARLTGWTAYELAAQPVLACAPDALGVGPETSVRRDFVAGIQGESVPPDDSIPPLASVQVEVLQLADAETAGGAAGKVAAWIEECASPGDGGPPPEGDPATVDLGDGTSARYWTRVVSAPEYCGGGDCDAAVFDREGVAVVGDRVVLVSLREVGGPLEPEGLDETMRQLLETAAARAAE